MCRDELAVRVWVLIAMASAKSAAPDALAASGDEAAETLTDATEEEGCFPCVGAHWRLDEFIGGGSFATVFKARAISSSPSSAQPDRAAKVLTLGNLSPEGRERAAEEAKLWQNLGSHLHIVTMLGSLSTSDHIILLLELATGGELFSRISHGGEVLESDAARWMSQLLLAIDFLHSAHGVIHRDLKPENMLLASPARDAPLKLADFGTAKKLLDPRGGTRTPCGSLGYAAPEQMLYLRGQMAVSYGRAADIWSVGITAYTVLSGTLPFNPRSVGWVRTVPARIDAGEGMEPLELTFPEATFGQTSAPARSFVAELLQLDPTRRPSAAHAQNHEWLSMWLGDLSPRSSGSGDEGERSAAVALGARMAPASHDDPVCTGDPAPDGGLGSSSDVPRPLLIGPNAALVAAAERVVARGKEVVGRPAPPLLQPGGRPPSRRVRPVPLPATPLGTPENLRGVTARQFASEWEEIAKVSASWLQRRHPRSSLANDASSRPSSSLADPLAMLPSRQSSAASEWARDERLQTDEEMFDSSCAGDTSASESDFGGGSGVDADAAAPAEVAGEGAGDGSGGSDRFHDATAADDGASSSALVKPLSEVAGSAAVLLGGVRDDGGAGSSSSSVGAGSGSSPVGPDRRTHFRRRPSPLAKDWRPKPPTSASSAGSSNQPSPTNAGGPMLFRRRPSPLAQDWRPLLRREPPPPRPPEHEE